MAGRALHIKSATTAGWLNVVTCGIGGWFYAGHPIIGTLTLLVQLINFILLFLLIGMLSLPFVWLASTLIVWLWVRHENFQKTLLAQVQEIHRGRLEGGV